MNDGTKYEAGIASDAQKNPVRVVFVSKKTSAKVKGDLGRQLMSYPNLILREVVAFQVVTIVLVVLALFWDAPLEQLANPLLTPNPAKAPWYFLGLQELLHYFPPIVAGIIIPGLVVLALVVVPYFNVNIRGEPLWATNSRRRFLIFVLLFTGALAFLGFFEAWTVLVPTLAVGALILIFYFIPQEGPKSVKSLRERPVSWWVMTWFLAVSLVLTVVGTFFRGPGWSWVWPWR